MQADQRLEPEPGAEPAEQVGHALGFAAGLAGGGGRGHRELAAVLARAERLDRHGFEPQHLDAEAGVDRAELQRQQRPDRLRPVGGAREADLAQRGLAVGADQGQPHPPRALAGGAQPGAERRQQPVDAGEDVRLEADRLGEGQPEREDMRRPRRRDRLRSRGRAPGRAGV